MTSNDVEKQSISIALIDGNQQQVKEEFRPVFHRSKSWCTGNYLVNIIVPMAIIIVMIILILIFRERNGRCSILSNLHRCQQTDDQSH